MVDFRLHVNDRPVRAELLDAVESVAVEQEIDKVWEALVRIPDCQDAHGRWRRAAQLELDVARRLRVEVRVADHFVPLFDGAIVGVDAELSGEPGQSTQVVHALDDSLLLNLVTRERAIENRAPHEIAEDIGRENGRFIGQVVADPVSLPPAREHRRQAAQRRTDMQLLRELASNLPGFYAYVLPGAEAGKSVLCFRQHPEGAPELPHALVLTGPRRNLAAFNASESRTLAAETEASDFDILNRTVLESLVRSNEVGRLDRLLEEQGAEQRRITVRAPGVHHDPARLAEAAARRLGWSTEASGRVLGGCFRGVLRPYEVVRVEQVDRYAGRYLVWKVKHTLDGSRYEQQFELKRNRAPQVERETRPHGGPSLEVSIG